MRLQKQSTCPEGRRLKNCTKKQKLKKEGDTVRSNKVLMNCLFSTSMINFVIQMCHSYFVHFFIVFALFLTKNACIECFFFLASL